MSSGPSEFVEGYSNDATLDQLDKREVAFDWDTVFRNIDGLAQEIPLSDAERLAPALHEHYVFLLGDVATSNFSRQGLEFIGRRVLAFAWTVDPRLIADSPSLREMARRLGLEKMLLSRHAAAARRRWRIRNRASGHAWNFAESQEGNS